MPTEIPIEQLLRYQRKASGRQYESNSVWSDLYASEAENLRQVLVDLCKNKGIDIHNSFYSEKPDKGAGRKPWRNSSKYIISGIYPILAEGFYTEKLFIKLEFNLSPDYEPRLKMEVDINAKKKPNPYDYIREGNMSTNFYSLRADDFPSTYEGLVDYLSADFDQVYEHYISFLKKHHQKNHHPTNMMKSHPLNQILYGPPGTGKTYRTAQIAVEICEGYAPVDRTEILEAYERLKQEGRVQFTTFHQSMTYEDYVEGIKPVIIEDNDEGVGYTIQPGIFKQMASPDAFDQAYRKLVKEKETTEGV